MMGSSKLVMILLIAILILSISQMPAFAHQNGCHRWHSCPSDTGSYICGDTGYCSECPDNQYCKNSMPIDSSTVTYTNPTATPTTPTTIPPTPTQPTPTVPTTPSPSTTQIPSWIKNNAKWWSQGQLADSDFTQGIQYLMEQGIVKIPQTSSNSSSSNQIPSWVKNNAKWWSQGQIDDSEFVKGIQYLVQTGVIHTKTKSTCQAINGILPDPNCTPGAADPRVTQGNIQSTICVPGYTKTVRPSTSVTDPIKTERMKAYGYTDSKSNYELDHLIPLELGGAPSDIKNLWPESYNTNPGSYDKDKLENYLHAQVCSGAMDLVTAQNEIATNWEKYWSDIYKPTR